MSTSDSVDTEAGTMGYVDENDGSTHLKPLSEAETESYDLHPIELTVHSLLNGPLDSLGEGFEQLGQSQLILLTRLKHMERRLSHFQEFLQTDSISGDDIKETNERITELNRRLRSSVKTLTRADQRMQRVEERLQDGSI